MTRRSIFRFRRLAAPHAPDAARRRLLLVAGLLLGTACLAPPSAVEADSHAALPTTPSEPGTRVYLITPKAGAAVSGPFTVRFGLAGMGVAPAGVQKPGTGHHHLIIDAPIPPAGLPIPADDKHRHFGGGQTEVTLTLPPGQHTLQLLLADHLHIPHVPPIVSKRITITVTN